MTNVQQQINHDDLDEQKKKRMESNRDAARRSRMKKQQHVNKLIAEISQLQTHNKVIMSKINEAANMFVYVSSENNVLRTQLSELTTKLHSLNSLLCSVNKDAFVEPYQFAYPPQPVTYSANMFNC